MKQTSFFLIYFNLKMLQFQLPNDVYLLISWWILYRSCDGHPSNTVEIICIADRKSSLLWLCTIPFYFNDVTMKAGHILLITEHLPVWNWISTCQHYTFGYSFFSIIFRICLSFLLYSLAFKYTWSSPIFYETLPYATLVVEISLISALGLS